MSTEISNTATFFSDCKGMETNVFHKIYFYLILKITKENEKDFEVNNAVFCKRTFAFFLKRTAKIRGKVSPHKVF